MKACQFIQTNCKVQKFIWGKKLKRAVKWDGTVALLNLIYFLDELSAFYLQHPCVYAGKLKGVVGWSQLLIKSLLLSWLLTLLALWKQQNVQCIHSLIFLRYETMAKTLRMYNCCGLTFFFSFFTRSRFFILRSCYVGTGSHVLFLALTTWEVNDCIFSSCGCDKVPCDVTWLWLFDYPGFCFDSISMLTRSHHLASHTLTAFWLLCDSIARPSFLPSSLYWTALW